MPVRFKPRILGAAVAIAMGVMAPLSARAETLADTLTSAYNNSGLLEQNRALLRVADENVAQVVSGLKPIINWSAGMTRRFGQSRSNLRLNGLRSTDFTLALTFDLLLYDAGATDLRRQAARESVLATRENLRNIEQQVLLGAVVAYMDVRRTSELVAVRRNNLSLLRQELRAARDRFEVGEVTRTDVALAEAQLASAQSGLAAAQGDLARAVAVFKSAVGRDPGQLRAPGRLPELSGDEAAARGVAVRKHPEIMQAQHEVAAADLSVLAARADMKPKVSLNSSISTSEEVRGSDYTRSGSIGLSLNGPIYRGGLLSSLVREALASRDQARAGLHLVRLQVEQDVSNAFADLRAAQASRRARSEEVRAARVAFRGLREEAKLGARTTLDVLDAEQDLLDARAGLIDAETSLFVAAYTVLESIGELTARDLRLNVRTYDPAAYYNLVKDAPVPISPQGQKLDRVLRALGKE